MTTNDPLDSLLDSLTLDQLPALPKIHDPAIAKAAITHRSYSAAYRQTGAVEDNYEKLAHVGDALLGVSVVLLLHELWPQMNKGEATTLKSRLVSSTTLAALSSTYGIPATIRMPPSGQTSILNNERNAAEMFEAHVGAVYTDQLQRAAADARAQKAQAYMAVSDWLQALFTPLAQAGYNPANIGEERENELAVGALPALHEHIQKYSWPTAKYEDVHLPLSPGWTMKCTVSDRKGRVW